MEKKGNDPLREEWRSSQVYNVLKGSGIPMAGKIVQGLDKATQSLDQVVGGFTSGMKNGPTGHPYQAPPGQPGSPTPGNQGAPQNAAPPQSSQPTGGGTSQPQGGAPYNGGQTGNGYYHYNYTRGNPVPNNQQPANQGPQQPPPPQNPGRATAQTRRKLFIA